MVPPVIFYSNICDIHHPPVCILIHGGYVEGIILRVLWVQFELTKQNIADAYWIFSCNMLE